ncbi:amidase signature enzyme [Thozetella sp. PMI_491]|nr:amidase signature enzyme [Thozetella sp. PMI_491]
MSVFTLDTKKDNLVTVQVLDEACTELGVAVPVTEKESYRTLLAVFHEAAEDLMSLEGPDLGPDLERFPRGKIYKPEPEDNPLGAWAFRCHAIDKQAPPGGLLEGRSIAIKDCVALAGVPMMMGSSIFDSYTPDIDATLVTRILEAGGIITGRAVCENLCHSGTSHSAASGVVHNPYAHGYSSGGSSSGSGALVGSGAVDMAIGADQGGSIRIPAGWCGLYGLKPTHGLVPYTGCGSNEPTNDHAGPITRTLLDNALLLQAIAGTDGIDDRSFGAPVPAALPDYHGNLLASKDPKNLSGVRIGIIRESLDRPGMDPRVLEKFHSAVDGMKKLGATVEEVSIPMHKHGAAIWTGISKAGGAATKLGITYGRRGYIMNDLNAHLAPLTQSAWDQMYPSSKNIFLNGIYAMRKYPTLLGHATNLSLKLRQDYDKALASYSVLVSPTLPYIANSHATTPFACATPENPAAPLDLIGKQLGLTSNTAPFNQSGHPALAMPCGMLEIEEGPLTGTGTRLPVSLQVVGKWFGEEDVYRVAYAWSLDNDWKQL